MTEKTQLSYSEFLPAVTELLRKELGSGYKLELHQVLKNNGIVLDGLMIGRPDEMVLPNLYLMPYYKEYQGHGNLKQTAGEILSDYRKKGEEWQEEFDYSLERMRDQIIYRVVSLQKNQELLQNVPHDQILDLAITYHCLITSNEEEIGTVRITNEHLARWNATQEEIRELACRNTPRLFPAILRSMSDVLGELFESETETEPLSMDSGIFILTNQRGINGASCMLYPQILDRFRQRVNCDFYILPSSIHEILLVPVMTGTGVSDMSAMVSEINRTQVSKEEVLSDEAYLYSEVCSKLEALPMLRSKP